MHLLDPSSYADSDQDQAALLHTGNILLVDDTKANLIFLARLLSAAGHQVQLCQSSPLALEMAIAEPPDLVISDVRMPEMDGYELCQRLKQDVRTQHIPIIFISVFDDLKEKAKAFEVGGVDYITKPFDAREVVLRVKTHVRMQALYSQLKAQNQLLRDEIVLRKSIEVQLRNAEEKFKKAFYSSPNPSTITLMESGKHIEVNDSFCLVTGYSASEILGRTALELNLWVNPEDRDQLFELIRTQRQIKNYEFQFRTKSGHTRTAILSCEVIEINGQKCLLSLSNDITARKRAESRLKVANNALQRLADLDGLTMIANRRRFDTYLKYHWERVRREGGYLALFLGDVDHFKAYNDCYGHLQGDQCLIQLAKILQQSLQGEMELAARYGGEEFAIILPGRSPEEAQAVIQRVWEAIQQQIPFDQSPLLPYVTMSFGGYTLDGSQEDLCTARQMIAWADEALYRAKRQGRNCIVCKETFRVEE